jgi:hypothetical protein
VRKPNLPQHLDPTVAPHMVWVKDGGGSTALNLKAAHDISFQARASPPPGDRCC